MRVDPGVGLLLAFALLAGCLGGGDGGADPFAVVQPMAAATTLSACDILEASLTVPEARVRGLVPPGFSVRGSDGSVGVVLGAATCAEGSRAFLAIAVTPDDERLEAEGMRHFYEPEHLAIPSEPFAEALAALRGNATNATRIVASAAPPQPAFIVEGAGGWSHRGVATGAALAPAPEQLVGGVFREWFPARGGYGYLESTFGSEGAGFALLPQASVETGEGTVSRDVLGAEATAELFVLAGSAYADATLGFVPYP